ncbi:MAG TPA: glycosyltransferase family 2 protein [Methylotenera sp.]|nr:glycosyltransferase family 2 protein [Methylotenera sp.]HPH06337.1 glycosyltransferase family 2 protein [Methylotenera sp.]HPN00844.1 glycosyltransferase family 2 protein [Methylotenera sp.]
MTVVEILLSILILVLLIPVLVLFKQVLLAALVKVKSTQLTAKRPSIAVIVPAHNEHLLIQSTIASVLPQLTAQDRIIVVADNCTDDTAKIAREAGAEAIERFNQDARGKGYALDFGVRHCTNQPPEVIIIIDADCQVGEGALNKLAIACVQYDRPIQALYLMKSPAGAGLKTKIAEFAWLVKNLVRPSGYAVLGLPCQLMGTGMAFTWQSISQANLASGHIVEDLKLGIDYCLAEKPPLFLPEALVTSEFPTSTEGLSGQRTRWEHGHLGVIFSEAPSLFVQAISKGNTGLLALAFDLIVPPLALLMLLMVTVFVVAGLFYAVTDLVMPLCLALAGLVLLGSAVLLAWAVFGRKVISLASLCYAPIYALMKIPVYLNFLIKRQVSWVRAKRDD